MVYDQELGAVVLFGGQGQCGSGGDCADTWTWDGTMWRLLADGGAGQPSARYAAAMAYDGTRRRVVLFSGSGSTADTWELGDGGWESVDAGATVPSARYFAGSTYDESRHQVLVVAGYASAGGLLGDTWGWDGAAWTLLASDGGPSLAEGGMVYDSARRVGVLYGGCTDCSTPSPFSTLWEWAGASWMAPTTQAGPGPRMRQAMAFDVARGRTILMGGDGTLAVQTPGTWEWDGVAWRETLDGGPPPQDGAQMAYDCKRGVSVLFGGGSYTATWEYGVVDADGGWVPGVCPAIAAADGGPPDARGDAGSFDGGGASDAGPVSDGAMGSDGGKVTSADLGCSCGGLDAAPAALLLALAAWTSAWTRRKGTSPVR